MEKERAFEGEDEEEMLRRAIAMSLEVETEEKESFSIKGDFSFSELSNFKKKTFQKKRWLPT